MRTSNCQVLQGEVLSVVVVVVVVLRKVSSLHK